MFAYEKGLIWGNDNYRTNGALVNVALATGNIGRPGGGCVRMGGHQEGYSRPSDAHVGRPAAYVDQLLIEGKGGVHHIWGCDHYKTTLNALKFKQAYKKRTDMVKDAMSAVPYGDRNATDQRHRRRDQERRTVRGRRRHRADQDRPGLPRLAAGGDIGRSKPHLDERRAAHAAHRALHGPARPGHAGLPDRGTHRQPHGARAARAGQDPTGRRVQGLRLEDRGRRLHGRLSPSTRRAASSSPTRGCGRWARTASRSRPSTSRTARSSAPSASMPTASSAARTARPRSWKPNGAACRRRARKPRRTSGRSSSTTAAPTSSGRTPISTRTTNS